MPRKVRPAPPAKGALVGDFRFSDRRRSELARYHLPADAIPAVEAAATTFVALLRGERTSAKPKEVERARREGISASLTAFFLPTGRPVAMSQRHLAAEVAGVLAEHGVAVEDRRNGPFVAVIQAVFDEAGGPSEARNVARDYLRS